MRNFWIYAIECIETGQIYIGQTSKPSPFWRWSYHMNALKNRYTKNSLFQQVWDMYPNLVHWRFQALRRVKGKVNANHCEVEEINKVPKDKRLNLVDTSPGLTLEQHDEIRRLLENKVKGYIIAKEVGVSNSTVSGIKKLIFDVQ